MDFSFPLADAASFRSAFLVVKVPAVGGDAWGGKSEVGNDRGRNGAMIKNLYNLQEKGYSIRIIVVAEKGTEIVRNY